MGRNAGHLALGIGKSAGAALTVIPEEFPSGEIRLDDVAAVIEGAILKRKAAEDRDDGIAVVSEGFADKFPQAELASLAGVDIAHDPHGHIRLGELPLSAIVRRAAQDRFARSGRDLPMVDVTIGYELRCASPISFDIDYTRSLGYGAANLLLSDPDDPALADGGLIYLEGEQLKVMPFDDMLDPATGRTRVRMVNTRSQYYQVARQYMTRIRAEDLRDEALVARMAALARTDAVGIRTRFGGVA